MYKIVLIFLKLKILDHSSSLLINYIINSIKSKCIQIKEEKPLKY